MALAPNMLRQIDRKLDRARMLDICIDIVVERYEDDALKRVNDRWKRSYAPSWPAASINKLAVALFSTRYAYNSMLTWSAADVREGGGVYDQPGSVRHALFFDVLYDMIARSGNTALVVLGRHNVSAINAMISGMELSHSSEMVGETSAETRLIPKSDGFFETGTTNPEEALKMLIASWKAQSPSSDVIRSALMASRSHIPTVNDVNVASKHGELNDDDACMGMWPYIRHEVGLMSGPGTGVVAYAIFTRSPNRFKAKLAEQMIGQIGAQLTQAVGARPTRSARLLGKTVLTT